MANYFTEAITDAKTDLVNGVAEGTGNIAGGAVSQAVSGLFTSPTVGNAAGQLAGAIAGQFTSDLTGKILGNALGVKPGRPGTMHDYAHASKLFVADNHRLAPNHSYLYSVYFSANMVGEAGALTEFGMLVKRISLPKFSIDTKTFNAYNRSHTIQSKIKYDPINIVFHDDSADVVRNFWKAYYAYYYYDISNATPGDLTRFWNARNEVHGADRREAWGFTGRPAQFTTSIRISSLHNKSFSDIILLNPLIKSFQHGDHDASASGDVLQNTMTVEYDGVAYDRGSINRPPLGFGESHYDHTPSSIPHTMPNFGSKSNPFGAVNATISAVGGKLLDAGVNALTGGLIDAGKNFLSNGNPISSISIPGIGNAVTRGATSALSFGQNLVSAAVSPTGLASAATGPAGVARVPASFNVTQTSQPGSVISQASPRLSNIAPPMPPAQQLAATVETQFTYAGATGITA